MGDDHKLAKKVISGELEDEGQWYRLYNYIDPMWLYTIRSTSIHQYLNPIASQT